MTKFFNVILILVILIAGGRLMMRGQEYREVSQERVQLFDKLGGFRVRDPSKYLIQFVENDDPKLFRWRIYTPGGFETRVFNEFGGRKFSFSCSKFGEAGNLGATSVCFEIVEEEVYFDTEFIGGGQRARSGGAALLALCTEHWSDLHFEALGRGRSVEVEVDQVVDLLKITIPDELFNKLMEKHGQEFSTRFSKRLLFQLRYGEHGMIESIRLQKREGTL